MLLLNTIARLGTTGKPDERLAVALSPPIGDLGIPVIGRDQVGRVGDISVDIILKPFNSSTGFTFVEARSNIFAELHTFLSSFLFIPSSCF
jgi:hypothetical protein